MRMCRGRIKNNSPKYRRYHGRQISIYNPPLGIGLIDKIRGEARWNRLASCFATRYKGRTRPVEQRTITVPGDTRAQNEPHALASEQFANDRPCRRIDPWDYYVLLQSLCRRRVHPRKFVAAPG